jgi:hypothetical protein
MISLLFYKNSLKAQQNVPQNQTNENLEGQITENTAQSAGFADERQAFDSLTFWISHPKSKIQYGFLSEDGFFKQLRLIDTITPYTMARAQHVVYKHKMRKSIEKFKKYCKSNKLTFKKLDSLSGLPLLVKWPPIVYQNKGVFKIKRYEIELTKKKLKYILQFELWWIDGRGYWTNELRYYDNTD